MVRRHRHSRMPSAAPTGGRHGSRKPSGCCHSRRMSRPVSVIPSWAGLFEKPYLQIRTPAVAANNAGSLCERYRA
jgi:hypothetical protein